MYIAFIEHRKLYSLERLVSNIWHNKLVSLLEGKHTRLWKRRYWKLVMCNQKVIKWQKSDSTLRSNINASNLCKRCLMVYIDSTQKYKAFASSPLAVMKVRSIILPKQNVCIRTCKPLTAITPQQKMDTRFTRGKSNILERPLTRPKTEVSLSAFALLFSEMVQYCQSRVYSVSELQTRLADMGQSVGASMLDVLVLREKNGKRETKVLNMLLFVKVSKCNHTHE